ncbi:MAG: hypothetical protein ABI083_02135 [Lapillicoccus sp.]
MTTVTSPSPMFPGAPTVSVDLPQGWEALHRAGSLLAARGPGQAYAPTLDVLEVRAATGAVGVDVARAVREVGDSAPERLQGVTSAPFRCVISGLPFVGLDRSWVDEVGGSVVEVHLFHATAPLVDGGVSLLVRLVGTCGGDRVQEDYAVLRRMALAASVVPWREPLPSAGAAR